MCLNECVFIIAFAIQLKAFNYETLAALPRYLTRSSINFYSIN